MDSDEALFFSLVGIIGGIWSVGLLGVDGGAFWSRMQAMKVRNFTDFGAEKDYRVHAQFD